MTRTAPRFRRPAAWATCGLFLVGGIWLLQEEPPPGTAPGAPPAAPPWAAAREGDPFRAFPVIDEESSRADARGRFTRTRVLRRPGPDARALRVVERHAPGGPGERDRVVHRTVMAADRLIVKLTPGDGARDRDRLDRIAHRYGARLVRPLGRRRTYLLAFDGSRARDLPAMLARLAGERDEVAFAHPDYAVLAPRVPAPLPGPAALRATTSHRGSTPAGERSSIRGASYPPARSK